MSEYKPTTIVNSFTLERLRLGITKRISKFLLEKDYQTTFEVIIEDMAHEFYVHIAKDKAIMKKEKEISFTTPKTWWDHFKMRFRKNWIIKRLKPVQWALHKYKVDKMLVFPDFEIPRGKEFLNYFIIYQANKKEE